MAEQGKRKAGDSQIRPNKRARQRELKKTAHSISSQTEQKSGRNAVEETLVKLPSQIQVDKYISYYAYEIAALHNAIKASSIGSSIRAWQMLPRHLRRRNASHNLLALPKRLRDKGRIELRASKTAPQSRSEIRYNKGKGTRLALGAYPRRRESSRRRELIQRAAKASLQGRAWMETHLWHAKRFRMSSIDGKIIGGKRLPTLERWGFTLAEETSMKSYRSTWRDQKQRVTVMDCSYDAWFRLSTSIGKDEEETCLEETLVTILQKAGLVDGWTKEWSAGERCCTTLLQKTDGPGDNGESHGTAAVRCLGPARVLWVAQLPHATTSCSRKRREVLIRAHPAVAPRLHRSLRTALAASSRHLKAKTVISRLNSLPHPVIVAGSGAAGRRHSKAEKVSTPLKKLSIDSYLEAMQTKWMRSEAYNSFEIAGRGAASLILKVLRPIKNEESTKIEAIQKMRMRDGAVIPLEVHDPRLSFPPGMSKRNSMKSGHEAKFSWSTSSRLLTEGAPPPTFCKGEIDSRRSKLTIPGSRLLPNSKDDIVPVLVVFHENARTSQQSFSLLVPRGWGQAFWLSLVHPGTRVIGQVQHHALNFDKGIPTFPDDWAGSPGFHSREAFDSLIASDQWSRKPPAKRCNFAKLDIKWPFGGSGMWNDVALHGRCIVNFPPDEVTFPPWTFTSPGPLMELVEDFRKEDLRGASKRWSVLASALICVRIVACRKGSFSQWDEIHFLDFNKQNIWRKALCNAQQDSHSKHDVQNLETQAKTSSTSHVGSITTGNFTLSGGKSSALASISLLALLAMLASPKPVAGEKEEKVRTRNPIPLDNLVLVKSVQGGVHRAASLQIVSLL